MIRSKKNFSPEAIASTLIHSKSDDYIAIIVLFSIKMQHFFYILLLK